jgi:hypothetical protein
MCVFRCAEPRVADDPAVLAAAAEAADEPVPHLLAIPADLITPMPNAATVEKHIRVLTRQTCGGDNGGRGDIFCGGFEHEASGAGISSGEGYSCAACGEDESGANAVELTQSFGGSDGRVLEEAAAPESAEDEVADAQAAARAARRQRIATLCADEAAEAVHLFCACIYSRAPMRARVRVFATSIFHP